MLDEESKKHIGNGQFNFTKVDDSYGVMIEDNPEAAIAYEETYLKKIFKQAGLKIVEPIHFGNWSTRVTKNHGQDILIVRKV